MNRLKTLLALNEYRRSQQQPPTTDAQPYVVGYNAQSGTIQIQNADGGIKEVYPAHVSGLGLGERGVASENWFV